MSKTLQSLRGMHDVLPSQIGAWHFLERCVRDVMNSYGYREMRTPIVESTALFKRSIGEVTDIVEKEMYSFLDRKEQSISLRPEATASCVRAALQHGLIQSGAVSRIWYQGPMFRYERPQKGRTRQFHQVGAEVYGMPGPAVEAELILLSARLWQQLGIADDVQLEVNTLGSAEDRDNYRRVLVKYFNDHMSELDEDSLRRLETNPLRILDSKNPALADMLAAAPSVHDSLAPESAAHFEQLQEYLQAAGVKPVINSRLVRGLDYYSHTVFEWTTELLGAQSAVCAGGRYDGLIEQLGGKPAPGVGWAMGMERLIELIMGGEAGERLDASPDIYVIVADDVDKAKGISLAEQLRDTLPGASILQGLNEGSLKSQFKKADRSGARFAVILGQAELEAGRVTLKPLRDGGDQTTATMAEIAQTLEQAIN